MSNQKQQNNQPQSAQAFMQILSAVQKAQPAPVAQNVQNTAAAPVAQNTQPAQNTVPAQTVQNAPNVVPAKQDDHSAQVLAKTAAVGAVAREAGGTAAAATVAVGKTVGKATGDQDAGDAVIVGTGAGAVVGAWALGAIAAGTGVGIIAVPFIVGPAVGIAYYRLCKNKDKIAQALKERGLEPAGNALENGVERMPNYSKQKIDEAEVKINKHSLQAARA